jgi:hypothetical protein
LFIKYKIYLLIMKIKCRNIKFINLNFKHKDSLIFKYFLLFFVIIFENNSLIKSIIENKIIECL